MLPQFDAPEFDKPGIENADLLKLPAAAKIHRTGVVAVVIAQSKADRNRYLVTWFNRHFWRVERQWLDKDCFEVFPVGVLPGKEAA